MKANYLYKCETCNAVYKMRESVNFVKCPCGGVALGLVDPAQYRSTLYEMVENSAADYEKQFEEHKGRAIDYGTA